jgi:hypothetical protein
MRRQLRDTDSVRTLLDNVPDRLFCHAIAPDAAHLVHLPKDPAMLDFSRR